MRDRPTVLRMVISVHVLLHPRMPAQPCRFGRLRAGRPDAGRPTATTPISARASKLATVTPPGLA